MIAGLRGWTTVPIIVLSARGDSGDKVEALDAGADDYVTKPFGMDELLARLRAAVRRAAVRARTARSAVVGTASFSVDLAARRSARDGEEVHLTPTEWGVLELLVRNRGRLVGQKQLLQRGVGPVVRGGVPLPAGLPGPAAAQAGAGAVAAPAPAHRDRGWVTASRSEPGLGTPRTWTGRKRGCSAVSASRR